MSWRTAMLVFGVCLIPRLCALALWPVPDQTLYYGLATGLIERRTFSLDGAVSTGMEPFYPVVLAVLRLAAGDRLALVVMLQAALAAAAGIPLFALTADLTGRSRAAWFATLGYACSPYLVRQAVAFMEVAAGVAILILAAWCMRRTRTAGTAVLAGLVLGLAVLTRFSYLPIAVGGLAIVAGRDGARRAAQALAAFLLCVAPWMLRGAAIDGSVVPSRVGENLFESTTAWAEHLVPRINVDVLASPMEELLARDARLHGVGAYTGHARDRVLLRYALRYIRAHPGRAVALKLRNLAYIFQPRLLPFWQRRGDAVVDGDHVTIEGLQPRPAAFEWIAGAWQALVLAGGIAGLLTRRRWRDDAFLLVVGGTIIAVQTVFYPTSRLLAPLWLVLTFYAAVAFDRLLPA